MRMNISRVTNSGFTGAGGAVTGPLVLSGDPVQPLQAATKQYVDSTVNIHNADNILHLTSNEKTLLNEITVNSTEVNRLAGLTSNLQQQIDGKANLSGGTFTGFINLHSNPSASLHLVTKQYADSVLSSIGGGLSIGDVVRKTVSTTPTGFLR
ncbi:MAG: hypothetical protein ACD_33C00011G0001, partial [uncultured bacterium]